MSRVSRLLRMGTKASTASVSWLPTSYTWSKRFQGLRSLPVSPKLTRPRPPLQTIAFILRTARAVLSQWTIWRNGRSAVEARSAPPAQSAGVLFAPRMTASTRAHNLREECRDA